jgi:hypothetical protein|uniref:hypothetical protein n=1 Tax=Prosthecobacter sp. TaxID=1965333 RepID=UPI003783CAE4
MKCPALALLLTIPAAAQTLPFGVPQTPYEGTVTAKTETSDSLKITVSSGGAVHTLMQSGSLSALARKAFRQLQVGCVYSFPQRFNLPTDESKSFKLARLLDLEKQPPFRALVDDLRIEENRVSLFLLCADGRRLHFRQEGGKGRDQARQLVAALQPGTSYEFPACLKPAPSTSETTQRDPVLSQYIGEWRGTLEGDTGCFISLNCVWKADGQGFWREILFDNSSADPPLIDVAIVTADPATGRYLATPPRDRDQPATESTYDAATRTFTTRLPSPDPGVTRLNTATFTNDDRIDWKTTALDASGVVLSTTRGSYQRMVASHPRATPITSNPGSVQMVTTTQNSSPAGMGTQSMSITTTNTITPSLHKKERTLLELRDLSPFRGKITALDIGADSLSITIECGDDRQYLIHHQRDEQWEQHLSIAKRFKLEETFEFPDIVAADYTALAGEVKPSDAMRALAPFIGEWRVFWDSGPMKGAASKSIVRCFWKNDGNGLWREFVMPESTEERNGQKLTLPARTTTSLTTYDAAKGHYIERASSPTALPTHFTATWDASGQVWSQKAESSHPKPGTQINGIRRLVSPDRIDYNLKQTQADGTLIDEAVGHYERIKP